jgi:hypothetical protein
VRILNPTKLILVQKPEGKIPVGRTAYRGDNNIIISTVEVCHSSIGEKSN